MRKRSKPSIEFVEILFIFLNVRSLSCALTCTAIDYEGYRLNLGDFHCKGKLRG